MADENQYLEQIIKMKNKISIFQGMEDDIIKNVVKNIRFLQFDMHEQIIHLGDEEKDIYILLEGECRVMIDNNKTVGILKKNQVFGEFSPITNTPRSATVKANVPTTVIAFEIDFNFLDNEINEYAVLYKNFVTELIKKLNLINWEKRKGTL
mgnify:CR=1 FL=1